MFAQIVLSRDVLVQTLLSALELHDQAAAGHSLRMAMLALRLGQELSLGEDELPLLREGVLLHDVGKIGIPNSILNKPGSLSDQEWSLVRQHPFLGAELLRPIPGMQKVVPILLHHHERWDGTGYPHRLAGEAIPLHARICAVTEVFDSLLSDQVYRPAWPKGSVLETMEQERGRAFDPSIVDALSKLADSF